MKLGPAFTFKTRRQRAIDGVMRSPDSRRAFAVRTMGRLAMSASVCVLLCSVGDQADATAVSSSITSPGATASAVPAGAPSLNTQGCATSLDRAHMLRTRSRGRVVIRRTGDLMELALHQVGRYATRLAVSRHDSCHVDLVRFEHRWQSAIRELHARLRSPTGSWEIRVTFVHYDAARHILTARGHLEDHEVSSRAAAVCNTGQACNPTEIVYASNFIPFDSSF